MVVIRVDGNIHLFLNAGFFFRGLGQAEEFCVFGKFDRASRRNVRAGKRFRGMPETVAGEAVLLAGTKSFQFPLTRVQNAALV